MHKNKEHYYNIVVGQGYFLWLRDIVIIFQQFIQNFYGGFEALENRDFFKLFCCNK